MKKKFFYLGSLILFTPNIILAACTLTDNPTLGSLIGYMTCILADAVVPLIFALALVLFFYGVVQYVLNPTDETKKTKGKSFMIWGIIALTVMFSVYGLIEMLGGSFNLLDKKTISAPTVNLD